MGFGFNRMNEVVVQQTTQGFCRYLQAQAKAKLEAKGVVVGKLAAVSQACYAALAELAVVWQHVTVKRPVM